MRSRYIIHAAVSFPSFNHTAENLVPSRKVDSNGCFRLCAAWVMTGLFLVSFGYAEAAKPSRTLPAPGNPDISSEVQLPEYIPGRILVSPALGEDVILAGGRVFLSSRPDEPLLDPKLYSPLSLAKVPFTSPRAPLVYCITLDPEEVAARFEEAVEGALSVELALRNEAEETTSIPKRDRESIERESAVLRQKIEQRLRADYSLPGICLRMKEKAPSLAFAEPEYLYYAHSATPGPGIPDMEVVPDDPYYKDQWHLPFMKAPEGWGLETGSKEVRIAVIDSGVDYAHEDLRGNVSLSDGYDFVSPTRDEVIYMGLTPAAGEDYGPRDADPMDFFGHGTHVAGIACATGNNGVGVTGLMWRGSVVPVRALFAAYAPYFVGVGLETDLADALFYCADGGFDIINCSWGSAYPSALIEAAVKAAAAAGCLVVASAGNSCDRTPQYPAAYEPVLAVGALDKDDFLTSFTGWGEWVDAYAPGVSILSLRAKNSDMYGDGGTHIYEPDDRYYWASGTSMAAPALAGICGEVKSMFPGAPPEEVAGRATQLSRDFECSSGIGRWAAGAGDLEKSLSLPWTLPGSIRVIGVQFKDDEGGNGNWIPEPGEQGSLIFHLRSIHPDAVQASLGGELQVEGDFQTLVDDLGSWILPAPSVVCGNGENPFQLRIARDCPINQKVLLHLKMTSRSGEVCSKTVAYTLNPVLQMPIVYPRVEGKMSITESPYLFERELWIPEWSNLQVPAGMESRFGEESTLIVLGRLNVQGQGGVRTVFTSSDPEGTWGGVRFFHSQGGSTLTNAVIRRGSDNVRLPGGGGVHAEESNFVLDECTISDNFAGGLDLQGGCPLVRNSEITNNKRGWECAGIRSESQARIENNRFRENWTFSLADPRRFDIECAGSATISGNFFTGNWDEYWNPLVSLKGNTLFTSNLLDDNQGTINSGPLVIYEDSACILSNTFKNNKLPQLIYTSKSVVKNPQPTLIMDNLFDSNECSGCLNGCFVYLLHNAFVNNHGNSLTVSEAWVQGNLFAGNTGFSSILKATSALHADNNIFYGNKTSMVIAIMPSPQSGPWPDIWIQDSILWKNEANTLIYVKEAPCTVKYCTIQGGYPGVGNDEKDPLFLAPEQWDFRLAPKSPCRDSGNPDCRFNDADGTRCDRGVFGGNPIQVFPWVNGDFEYATVGTAKPMQVVLVNTLSKAVALEDISVQPPFHLAQDFEPFQLKPSDLKKMDILFKPEDSGIFSETLEIRSPDFTSILGQDHYSLCLSGEGTTMTVIDENTEMYVLKKADSPFLVTGYAKLISEPVEVEAGVHVLFLERACLGTKTIHFSGAPGEVIRLEGYEGAHWMGFPMADDFEAQYTLIRDIDTSLAIMSAYKPKMTHCTITGNQCEYFFFPYGTITLLDTIFYGNGGYLMAESGWPNFSLTWSDLQDLQYCIDLGADVTGSIEADPMFANPEEGDFHLLPGSPCLGSGLNGEDMGAFGAAR